MPYATMFITTCLVNAFLAAHGFRDRSSLTGEWVRDVDGDPSLVR